MVSTITVEVALSLRGPAEYALQEGVDFVFLPGALNTGRLTPPGEPNHWTRAVWKRRKVHCYKYVDDGLTVEKANFENVPEMEVDGITTREKHVIPTQNAFRSVKRAAENKGMKVNTLKTARPSFVFRIPPRTRRRRSSKTRTTTR